MITKSREVMGAYKMQSTLSHFMQAKRLIEVPIVPIQEGRAESIVVEFIVVTFLIDRGGCVKVRRPLFYMINSYRGRQQSVQTKGQFRQVAWGEMAGDHLPLSMDTTIGARSSMEGNPSLENLLHGGGNHLFYSRSHGALLPPKIAAPLIGHYHRNIDHRLNVACNPEMAICTATKMT